MAFVGRTDVKDPGAEQQQWDRLAQRRERLYAADEQFRDTRPDDAVAEAARRPGLRIAELMATVMEGYAGRPALGERARCGDRSGDRTVENSLSAALRNRYVSAALGTGEGGVR